MVRSSKLVQPRIVRPCSLAKCRRHMKHKCGETSPLEAAAVASLGKLDRICLNDTDSSSSFVAFLENRRIKKKCSLRNINQSIVTKMGLM